MTHYDTLLIGAGINGLTAAAYLAKNGRKVLILERKSVPGGIAVTEEFAPGYRASMVADGAGYISPVVARELALADFGLEYIPSEVVAFCPQPNGDSLTIWQDTARTVEEIKRFSKKDAESYPKFIALMSNIAGVVRALLHQTPLDLPDLSLAEVWRMRALAGPLNRLGRKNIAHLLRVLPMPVADLLNEWFESDALKGAIAASGVRDITFGPMEAGTAYTLLYKWALSNSGLFRSAGQVKGGLGGVTEVLVKVGKNAGAELRTGAEVAEICVEDGKTTGVRLTSGEFIPARTVISSADPRTTFLQLLNPARLDASFVRHVKNIKYRGSTARLVLALAGLPGFVALKGRGPEVLRGAIQIAPSVNYLQRAFDQVKYGEFSRRPYLDIRIPTLADPSLAVRGHVMTVTVKFAPYHLRGNWDFSPVSIPDEVHRHSTGEKSQRETFTDVVLDTLAEYAPDIREKMVGSKLLTPCDLEREYGLPEGNLNHGEMTLDQFFHMRPVPGWAGYRTPVEGVYLCGSGTHPGGGVTGLGGRGGFISITTMSSL
ncbi:MAG: NAD(P)/FAD-dependent oxidoreductase [Anaerolineales bacterium]